MKKKHVRPSTAKNSKVDHVTKDVINFMEYGQSKKLCNNQQILIPDVLTKSRPSSGQPIKSTYRSGGTISHETQHLFEKFKQVAIRRQQACYETAHTETEAVHEHI